MSSRERSSLAISLIAAVAVHGVVAVGMAVAEKYIPVPEKASVVQMAIVEPPPVSATKAVEPEPEPVEPEPVEPEPVQKRRPPTAAPQAAKVTQRSREGPEPTSDRSLPESPADPAPGPASEQAPGEEFVYRMPSSGVGGTLAVKEGAGPTGHLGGVKGGTGTGKGGGATGDGTGPAVASLASIARMPEPIGDTDRLTDYADYPEEAKRAGIQGPVVVRLLVTAEGRVSEAKVVKGLGHGLDAEALKLARRLRFKPAIDTTGRPVPVRITWTFHFTLPS